MCTVLCFCVCCKTYISAAVTEAANSPSVVQYESLFITSHKALVLAGAFSWDGQLAATGSADTTIKVC